MKIEITEVIRFGRKDPSRECVRVNSPENCLNFHLDYAEK